VQNSLNITLVQTSLIWEDKKANIELFDKHLSTVGKTDIIILPEMFTTGFSMQPHLLFEDMQGKTFNWMKQQAAQKKCAITGSIIVKENDAFYNRLIWVDEHGKTYWYNKRHLFRMAGEDKYYSMGFEKIIIPYKGWNICPLICYDLRFPVWSRNKYRNGNYDYDLLIYVANWPEPRNNAWKLLLQARAIENLCYVAGVNRIGIDGNNINYTGDSRVINYKGDILNLSSSSGFFIQQIEISKGDLEVFRNKFPAGMDADNFEIH
jgi:predicted amidohydrolase